MRRCNFSSLVLDQPRLPFSAGTNVSFMGSLATDVPGQFLPLVAGSFLARKGDPDQIEPVHNRRRHSQRSGHSWRLAAFRGHYLAPRLLPSAVPDGPPCVCVVATGSPQA